jgi:hypothetical protein
MDAHQSTHPNQKEIMTSHLPEVTSTPEERLAALKEAKALLFVPAAFSNGPLTSAKVEGNAPTADQLFRVAEYITTGHDYLDTHPTGKRRPIIQNVHVSAVGMPQEVAEKLIGDEFLDDLLKHGPNS